MPKDAAIELVVGTLIKNIALVDKQMLSDNARKAIEDVLVIAEEMAARRCLDVVEWVLTATEDPGSRATAAVIRDRIAHEFGLYREKKGTA